MRRFALLSLLFASAAGAQPIDPAGASDAEVIRGNVVVWHDATFYTSPSDEASTARVATLGPRRENAGHVIAMRAVATHGAFVEVELVDDAGCTWTKMSTSDFRRHAANKVNGARRSDSGHQLNACLRD
jgi:hypothetical protein